MPRLQATPTDGCWLTRQNHSNSYKRGLLCRAHLLLLNMLPLNRPRVPARALCRSAAVVHVFTLKTNVHEYTCREWTSIHTVTSRDTKMRTHI